jgi:arabinan endo-1,5-alpha-L-arabinosidase
MGDTMNLRSTMSLTVATLLLSVVAMAQSTLPQALRLSGAFGGTHDPSIAFDHGTYYVFATGAAYPARPEGTAPPSPDDAKAPPPAPIGQFPIRCSKDLHHWTRCGAVFPAIPEWIQQASPKTRELWAPDISYFDGLYHLYYAFSVFGKNTSGIALATNETLDPASSKYKWLDRGLVIRSYEKDDFNAIDPNLVLDAKGQAWLSLGSFWSGIKMIHLDRATGLQSKTDMKIYSLASRHAPSVAVRNPDLPPDTEAIEAPFIFRHGGYYYLTVSWDLCCRGTKSTYRTMVGRSKDVTGPYVDRDGKSMLLDGGTPLLIANATWRGPGGASVLRTPDGKPAEDLLVFHAYSAKDGHPAMQISTIAWKDGWPQVALEGDGSPLLEAGP